MSFSVCQYMVVAMVTNHQRRMTIIHISLLCSEFQPTTHRKRFESKNHPFSTCSDSGHVTPSHRTCITWPENGVWEFVSCLYYKKIVCIGFKFKVISYAVSTPWLLWCCIWNKTYLESHIKAVPFWNEISFCTPSLNWYKQKKFLCSIKIHD